MEIVIAIIMVLVAVSVVLKLTYLPEWGRIVVSLVLALFAGMSWTFAVTQSKTQIDAWILDPELMLNVAVLLTVDVFLQLSFCIMSAESMFGERMSRCGRIIREITLWIPGLLIFPTLLALLVKVIFSFPGMDFTTIAWSLGAVVFIAGMVLPFLIKTVIPEKDLRLELIFMINTMIALLGVVATVNGRTAVAGVNDVDWKTLVGVLSLLIVCAAAGYIMFKRKQNKITNTK